MTAFTYRFRTLASLGLPLLTWLLLLSTDAVSKPRAAVNEQRTVEAHSPRVHNPLAPSEIDLGKRIAETSDIVKGARTSAAGLRRAPGTGSLTAVQTAPPLQPLYVQHHNEDKNADPGSRKADVHYYNYSTNESIRVVVDLNSNAVQETQVTRGAANQPFFTRAEIQTALQLILEDPHTGPLFKKAYLEITGASLVNVASQLQDAQGGVFFHDPATPLGSVTAACVQDRCMQLFMPINEASYIDMVNVVVNLSKMQVLWVDAGPAAHIH